MEWLFLSPTDGEETVFKDHISLSSHRQHGDGTYSLSSHLTLPSSVSPGTKISCRVSHVALEAPLSISLMVEGPQTSMWLISLKNIVNNFCNYGCPRAIEFWSCDRRWVFLTSGNCNNAVHFCLLTAFFKWQKNQKDCFSDMFYIKRFPVFHFAGSYWWILGFLIITVLFFYQVMG